MLYLPRQHFQLRYRAALLVRATSYEEHQIQSKSDTGKLVTKGTFAVNLKESTECVATHLASPFTAEEDPRGNA